MSNGVVIDIPAVRITLPVARTKRPQRQRERRTQDARIRGVANEQSGHRSHADGDCGGPPPMRHTGTGDSKPATVAHCNGGGTLNSRPEDRCFAILRAAVTVGHEVFSASETRTRVDGRCPNVAALPKRVTSRTRLTRLYRTAGATSAAGTPVLRLGRRGDAIGAPGPLARRARRRQPCEHPEYRSPAGAGVDAAAHSAPAAETKAAVAPRRLCGAEPAVQRATWIGSELADGRHGGAAHPRQPRAGDDCSSGFLLGCSGPPDQRPVAAPMAAGRREYQGRGH
jgi:hypothetical protein